MSPLGCLALVGIWSSASVADTGVFFPHNNVRLRRSPDKLGGGGGGGGGGDPLDWLRKSIPGEPGKDYPIHGQNKLCELNPAQFGGSCGGGGGGGGGRKKNGGKKNGNGNGNGRGASKSNGEGGAGTGYGAPAEEAATDYNDYEGTAPEDDYNYDVSEDSEAAAASEPGGGYLAPAEDTPEEADGGDYDYSEEPATNEYEYDYSEEPAEEEYDAPASEEPTDYEYDEAPAEEDPADYDYNVAPEAEEPGNGYLAPEETSAAGSDDYEYEDDSAPAEEEAEPTDLDTGYLAPAQSEGRRGRNNRPATRKIAEELVSNARQLVRKGPNANDLRRLSARQNNGRSKGRRSRNNRPRAQPSGNGQRREKPKQNTLQRKVQNEKPRKRQNGTQKRGQKPNGRKTTRQNPKGQSEAGRSGQCPGGSLDNCIDVCPGSSAKVYVACVNGCSSRCEPQANPRRRN